MSSIHIDFNGITTVFNVKSLYIPRVFLNITEADIAGVFESLGLGEVDRIDLAPRFTASGRISANMAFVYFKTWSMSVAAQNLASRIVDSSRVARIVYDDPWYWVLLPNLTPLPVKPTDDNRIALTERIKELEDRVCKLENILDARVASVDTPQQDVGALPQHILSSRWCSAVTEAGGTNNGESEDAPPPSPPKLVRQNATWHPTSADTLPNISYDTEGNRFVWCPSSGKFFKDNGSTWCDP